MKFNISDFIFLNFLDFPCLWHVEGCWTGDFWDEYCRSTVHQSRESKWKVICILFQMRTMFLKWVNSFFIDQEFCMGHRLLLYVKVNERKGELGYLFGTKHNGTIKLQLWRGIPMSYSLCGNFSELEFFQTMVSFDIIAPVFIAMIWKRRGKWNWFKLF